MGWEQVLATILGNAAIFLPIFFWLRSESNADRRQIQQEISADRKDFLQLIKEIKEDLHAFQRGMDDFHNRLIKIEMERKK